MQVSCHNLLTVLGNAVYNRGGRRGPGYLGRRRGGGLIRGNHWPPEGHSQERSGGFETTTRLRLVAAGHIIRSLAAIGRRVPALSAHELLVRPFGWACHLAPREFRNRGDNVAR